MNYNQLFKQVDEGYAFVNKMFLVALCTEYNSDLSEWLYDEIEDHDIERMFPKIPLTEWNETNHNEISALLIFHGYTGWVIEVAVPERSGFVFKEGSQKYSSCRVHPGILNIRRFYSEAFEDILPKMKEIEAEVLKEDIARFRSEQENTQTLKHKHHE